MSWFWHTKKKSKWVDLNEQEFSDFMKRLPEFGTLARLADDEAAQTCVKALFIKSGGKTFAYMNTPEAKESAIRSMKGALQTEINNLLQCHYVIGDLAQKARARSFSTKLRESKVDPSEYGAHRGDTELFKAAQWIVHSSSSLAGKVDENSPINIPKIYRAMKHVVESIDVRSHNSLVYLHQHLVNQVGLQPSRAPSRLAKYCSIGGARWLQKRAGLFASQLPRMEPGDGDSRWDELACFVLGAQLRAHGFTDGNGRAVRGLFACVLVQGGRDFVVPDRQFEKSLHRL